LPDQAALDNVRAVAASNLSRSSARSVFARADIVLAWHSDEQDTHLVPLINEVSLLNSASKLIDLWAGPRQEPHWPLELIDAHAARTALPIEEQVGARCCGIIAMHRLPLSFCMSACCGIHLPPCALPLVSQGR
jgi:hypothetical protein